jgi:hypothetical protein
MVIFRSPVLLIYRNQCRNNPEAREICSVREISAICLDDGIIDLGMMLSPDSLSPEPNKFIAIG